MALIELSPGETFEHSHDMPSTTRLVAGQVDLSFSGQTIPLTSTPVVIPANTKHTMVNVGTVKAQLACDYLHTQGSP